MSCVGVPGLGTPCCGSSGESVKYGRILVRFVDYLAKYSALEKLINCKILLVVTRLIFCKLKLTRTAAA